MEKTSTTILKYTHSEIKDILVAHAARTLKNPDLYEFTVSFDVRYRTVGTGISEVQIQEVFARVTQTVVVDEELTQDELTTLLTVKDLCDGIGAYSPIIPSKVYDELCSAAKKGYIFQIGTTLFSFTPSQKQYLEELQEPNED